MAKIYVIRHGESIANTEGIYQGQTYDTSLSLLGIKQATAVAKRFRRERITALYASPLIRTQQTAREILRYHPTLRVQTEQAIIETNHGLWEGNRVARIKKQWPSVYKTWINNPVDTVFPDGESYKEIKTRVTFWWAHFIKQVSGTTIVVTHDNIIRLLLIHLMNMEGNATWKFQLQPTGITTIDCAGTPIVVCINDTNHLEGIEANLANHAL